jgi:isopenicillin-N N-acyltransferase like protein
MRKGFWLATLVVGFSICVSSGAEPSKTFPDAKHGQGEMKHVNGMPVLFLRGTPSEIGEQYGVLAVKNAPDLDGFQNNFFKDARIEGKAKLIMLLARRLTTGMPKHHMEEIEAAIKVSKRDRDLVLFANSVYDLSSNMGCSTVVVEKSRSKTGEPIFGRNFDWLASKGINEHTMLAIYQPAGKQAFATITISPVVGCISGMNEAGLAVTLNEIHITSSKDKAEFNWEGVPVMLAFRRVLEDCKTVAEAEKLLNEMKRTTTACMTICDKNGGAVFEISPKNLIVRKAVQDVCLCTNHFRSDALSTTSTCWRYKKLLPLQATSEKLGVEEVFGQLDNVNQGKSTLQSMVFEPSKQVLHLKYGYNGATKLVAKTFDLAEMFKKQ